MKTLAHEAVAVVTASPNTGSAFVLFASWFNRHLGHPDPWIGGRRVALRAFGGMSEDGRGP